MIATVPKRTNDDLPSTGIQGVQQEETDHYPVGQADSEDWEDVGLHSSFEQGPEERHEHRDGEMHARRVVLVVASEHSAFKQQVEKTVKETQGAPAHNTN